MKNLMPDGEWSESSIFTIVSLLIYYCFATYLLLFRYLMVYAKLLNFRGNLKMEEPIGLSKKIVFCVILGITICLIIRT